MVSVGLGWLLAGRLLRPLQAIVATARDISATNLSRRLRTGKRDDEFSRLGQTLNDLFARLEASFESQRHFVANAAHELRTPLAAERTVLQVALRDPDASVASLRSACDEVLRLGEQQEQLIDALLTLAGSERGIAAREPVRPGGTRGRGRDRGDGRPQVKLDARLGPRRPRAIPALAESLVANLVGNALRHNVPGGWASIETATVGGRAVLRVSNSGPVIPPAEVDRLFQPFQRLGDERARRRDGGTASGSPSSAPSRSRTARNWQPRARPEGGLDITVTFPPLGTGRMWHPSGTLQRPDTSGPLPPAPPEWHAARGRRVPERRFPYHQNRLAQRLISA